MSIFAGLFKGPVTVAELPYPTGTPPFLAARWLRWIASVSPLRDPVEDTTGEDAALCQPADVWFLASSYGKTVTRTCDVPAGPPLFFPVLTTWQHANGEALERFVDPELSCALDGEPQAVDEVVCAEPFEVAGRLGNPVTGRRKPAPMVCSGYWSRIPSPSTGAHTLAFRAVAGEYKVDVTYHLTVRS